MRASSHAAATSTKMASFAATGVSGISRAAGTRVEGLNRRCMGYHRDARDRQQRHRAGKCFRAVQRQHHDDGEAPRAGPLYTISRRYFWFLTPAFRSASPATRSTSSRRSLQQKKAIPSGQPMREDPTVQETIASCEAQLGAARSYVYSTLEDLWETLCKGDRPSPKQRAAYRMMMTYSHQAAKQLISTLYDTAATSSIFRSSRLDRDMRDILTACQHRVVHLKMYRPAGRLLLGLDPEEPTVLGDQKKLAGRTARLQEAHRVGSLGERESSYRSGS